MKKVLLIIVDALASRVIEPALHAGRLPNLRRLRQAATVRASSIAIFPSITPAATTSLITGRYPQAHGICGAYWYIPQEKKVIYFGYDLWAIMEKGIGTFVEDFLIRLNEERLSVQTLFQQAERHGKNAACLNFLIYHGDTPHQVERPLLLNLLPDAVQELVPDLLQEAITDGPTGATVSGPSLLYYGDAIQTPLASGAALSVPGGPGHRFGFSDLSSGDLLLKMVQADALPDLTVAYFPENDFRSHEVGPEAALDDLTTLDEQLGKVIAAYGGLSSMLDEVCVVLTGDHSQSNMVDDEQEAGIRLDELLASFSVADAGTPMDDEDDLVVCPNLRTAQIYFHTPTADRFGKVVAQLLSDPRIDQVMWSASFLNQDQAGYHVVTQDRGRLHFWPGDEGPQGAVDVYGQAWSWEGDLATVDGRVVDGVIRFGDYPNAFERMAGILDMHTSGHLWAASRPGYEFSLAHTKIHAGGGSHGSLHVLDSVSPLWAAGVPEGIDLPSQPRSVDVAPFCAAVLGLST